jgi:hypothetical protein
MFIGTLCAPDDTGRSTGGVETSVGFVAFMRGTEVTMGFGVLFCSMEKVSPISCCRSNAFGTTATEKRKGCVTINAGGNRLPRTEFDRSDWI